MAVIPTGAIYKTLNFDGQSSGTYGVYITGDAVFNAPERDVEMVKIPGRNGAFALDNGRFENIEVTYPAGIFAETEADFAAAISDFRNYLCSRKGYCRLTDDYNPDEYRLGIYKSGLEVEPALLKAGEFNITFECKPQRYLTTGENPIAVTSGDTLTNPTLFESGPLLEIEGYGTIDFNGYEIELDDDLIGDVLVSASFNKSTEWTVDIPYYMNIGDEITVSGARGNITWRDYSEASVTSVTKVSESGDGTATASGGGRTVYASFTFNDPLTFYYGTDEYKSVGVSFSVVSYGHTYYSGASMSIYLKGKSILFYFSNCPNFVVGCDLSSAKVICDTIRINSTATTYGHPTYIDCEIGEAYADESGVISSLNSYIELGSDLPKLAPGSNTVTFDNTITDLKITPRWWKV